MFSDVLKRIYLTLMLERRRDLMNSRSSIDRIFYWKNCVDIRSVAERKKVSSEETMWTTDDFEWRWYRVNIRQCAIRRRIEGRWFRLVGLRSSNCARRIRSVKTRIDELRLSKEIDLVEELMLRGEKSVFIVVVRVQRWNEIFFHHCRALFVVVLKEELLVKVVVLATCFRLTQHRVLFDK